MKRKNILALTMAAGLGIGISGCADYLDSDYLFENRMSIEKVFSSEDYSEQWLARAYNFMANNYVMDIGSKGNNPFCFSDDMYFGDRNDTYKKWKNGEYDENGLGDLGNFGLEIWKLCYRGIRQASIFLQNIDINKELTAEEIEDMKGQAHFLRAYYYWYLLHIFGPIPIVADEGVDYTESYDDLAQPRNTYEECVTHICNELIEAAKRLPLEREQLSIVRPTRGAALALRARVLLYAASPLFNGKAPADVTVDMHDNEGRKLLPETYDESKWAQAAAAALDVIELPGQYNGHCYDLYTAHSTDQGTVAYPATVVPPYNAEFSNKDWPNGWQDIDPFESYRALFNGDGGLYKNPEIIFSRGQNQGEQDIRLMVVHQLPRDAGGWNTHGMTLKMCDAYYMRDGSDFNRETFLDTCAVDNRFVTEEEANKGIFPHLNKDVWKEYAYREPRFYASVGYNGSVWNLLNRTEEQGKENIQVFYYRGMGNGYTNTMFWLRTGIGIKKFVSPNDVGKGSSNDVGQCQMKADPAIRYAETLISYAEALNELNGAYPVASWDGSKTYTISRDINEMKKGIRPIRIRAGLPDYDATTYASQDLFRKKMKQERQIEFMGEGQRYFDLRRWMDAPEEEAEPVYGCNALVAEDMKELFYVPVKVNSLPTTFSRKMWFWPIPHEELKRNRSLSQNPGWTLPE